MKLRLFALTLAAAATAIVAVAQTTPAPKPSQTGPFLTPGPPPRDPGTPSPTAPPPIGPDTIVASANGKNITASQMDDMTRMLTPQIKAQLWQKPETGVMQIMLMNVLSEEAKKRKLDQVPATRDAIESRQRLYLANAEVQEHNQNIVINDAETEAYYKAHKEDFEAVKISAIYINFTPNPKPGADGKMPRTEAEAKAKADDLVKQLRAGADFAKLAAEQSDDKDSGKKGGELTTIKRTDKYPQPIKDAVFKLKDGEISDPVKQPAGFYILKPTSRTTPAFAEVKESLLQRIRSEKFDTWMRGAQKDLAVTVEKPEYFTGGKPLPPPSLAAPNPVPNPSNVAPETVVATVGGKPYTAKQIDDYVKVLSPQQKSALRANPQVGLNQLFLILQLSDEARKQKLDQASPHKEALEMTERQELANAYITNERNSAAVTRDEEEAYYKSHPSNYELYKVGAILVSFSPDPKPGPDGKTPRTEDAAKARAEELVKQLRAGADFAKLAKESSDDKISSEKGGEYATFHGNDTNTPPNIKKAVLALKDGEVSDPVKQGAGYYIFKTMSKTAQPFAEVSTQIETTLKQEKFTQWITGLQNQYTAKIERPDYFKK